MSKPVTCPRCHGPAKMIDKAPKGERGNVVRCDVEAECAAVTTAAKDLDERYAGVVDAAQELSERMGRVRRDPAYLHWEVRVPGWAYLEFQTAVLEWKEAGQALHDTTVKMARAQRKSAA